MILEKIGMKVKDFLSKLDIIKTNTNFQMQPSVKEVQSKALKRNISTQTGKSIKTLTQQMYQTNSFLPTEVGIFIERNNL